jgi:uncharacterized protein YegP (UPF0339 family)
MFVEIYKREDKDWGWRLVASNGNIMADSAEGYRRRGAAKKAWTRIVEEAGKGIRVVEVL